MNATQTSSAIDAINALDLRPIKTKLMHVESGEGWQAAHADRVEVEYRRFLTLMKLYPNETTAPLVDVDIFWHYHILDTAKYAADCAAAFGYFLHHYPYLGLAGAQDEAAHKRAGARMQALYAATFGGDTAAAEASPAAWCGATTAQPAGEKSAWCGVPVASANAWCGATTTAPATSTLAWCGATTTAPATSALAWCGATTTAPATSVLAWCGATTTAPAASTIAWCGATTTAPATIALAWCGATTTAPATSALAWCGASTTAPAASTIAWCGAAGRTTVQVGTDIVLTVQQAA